ncbi:unnamed protein product [Ceutorhynchus assimilis]|uniref:Lymphoid-specific helicase n=1 Tax=Ceutorhynchus assimilis TaxID=467358 RepID=A0A9N9N1M3_9CUCU|nr:unnamed protein product [Ceutorhynchus assimilis]
MDSLAAAGSSSSDTSLTEKQIRRRKKRQEKAEREKIEAAERKEAALKQMRYLLAVCEQYSEIYTKSSEDQRRVLKDRNVVIPTFADIEGVKKETRVQQTIADYDVTKHLKYFENGQLHSYQIDGVKWMYMLHANCTNGILADEMGLGKTIQVIALICVLLEIKTQGPFMIIAPLSTIPNWENEFKRFAPQIPIVTITGASESRFEKMPLIKKKYKIGDFETFPVVIMSYQVPLMEINALNAFKWKYIIVDEGHVIKNHNTRLAKVLRIFRSENRLLLTGTPLQNNIEELWSLLNFLLPNFFRDMSTFSDILLMDDLKDENKLIQEEVSNSLVSKIHKVLAPFMLRRCKKDVLFNMVPKKEVTVYCPMSPLQIKLYDYVIARNIQGLQGLPTDDIDLDGPRPKRKCIRKMDYSFRSLDRYIKNACLMKPSRDIEDETNIPGLIIDKCDLNMNNSELQKYKKEVMVRLTMLSCMMMFKKIVNHPYLVHFPLDPNSKEKRLLINEELIKSSGKLLVLDTLLPELKKRGHKILLFSQLCMGLDLIEEYMILRNYEYRRLDGSDKLAARSKNMQEFNTDPNVFVFLLSTRAGGLGLNLTGADTVIFFDRDWNPQMDIQAQDRCHRIGQTKPVVVYTLTTKNTIDEHIIGTGQVKRVLEKVVISDGKFKTLSLNNRERTENVLIELRKALKKPEDDDCYIYSNDLELNRLLDRSDLYAQLEEINVKVKNEDDQ